MKVKTWEVEPERIELKKLPSEIELIAVSERFKEKAEGSTAGLIITFRTKDKREFMQKYSIMSGAVMKRALVKLGIEDTEELQKNWYLYTKTEMRMGYPRMIPTKKV